jgi:hypothetical protein
MGLKALAVAVRNMDARRRVTDSPDPDLSMWLDATKGVTAGAVR